MWINRSANIENVATTTFSSAEGETPATVLPKLIRTYPDAVVVRDVADLETLAILCEQPGEKRTAITTTRAKEATEALLRLMTLKIPPADLAGAVTAVVNVRLIRKLCEKCKEGYAPPAEVLKQLGLPAGRVEALYRPPTEPIDPKHPEVVCDVCQGIGYYGRTGIFELLIGHRRNSRSSDDEAQAGQPAGRGAKPNTVRSRRKECYWSRVASRRCPNWCASSNSRERSWQILYCLRYSSPVSPS